MGKVCVGGWGWCKQAGSVPFLVCAEAWWGGRQRFMVKKSEQITGLGLMHKEGRTQKGKWHEERCLTPLNSLLTVIIE